MTDCLKQELLEYYNNQKGYPIPVSNQHVINAIIYKSKEKLESFLQSKNAEPYKRWRDYYIIDGYLWKVVYPKESTRGYRFYKAYIDEDIDDETVNLLIEPYLNFYCCFVELF